MLKFFFACLLVANAALFAYQQGYLDGFYKVGHEPARAAKQLNADKIKIMSAAEAASSPVTGSGSASAAASTPAGTSDASKKPELLACTEVGSFSDAEADKFEKELASLTLGDRLSRRKLEDSSTRIILIPPQGTKEAADKKAADLRRFGITGFTVVKDPGPMQWSILLGTFKSQEEAQTRLAELNKKGVRTARITPENAYAKRISFQLRNLDTTTRDAVEKIKGEFAQVDSHRCE
jgi:hypothetical protein